MTGMTYHFGRAGRNVESISNRGCTSGGSCGGDKKAGIVTFGTTWSRGNMGNFIYRAPQTVPPPDRYALLTTRNPTQGSRFQVYRRGGGL